MEDTHTSVVNYRDLLVWQKGIDLVNDIYSLTAKLPKQEMYCLIPQLRRAAISIPSNIAEGHTRQYRKEYIQFVYISLGSLSEIDTQLTIAHELDYLSREDLTCIEGKIRELRKMLYSLLNKLSKRQSLP